MSAGHSLRRGYAYTVTNVHTTPVHGTVGAGERFTLVLVGAFVIMMVALLSNDVVASALGKLLGAAWAEIGRFVLHFLSGGAV